VDREKIRTLLESVSHGRLSVEEALSRLRDLPYEDLSFAKLDLHRSLRSGAPEAVLCEGKTVEQVVAIVSRLAPHHDNILATRATGGVYEGVRRAGLPARHHAEARMVVVNPKAVEGVGLIAVVSAGTSDIPVAEEAAVTAETLGNRVERVYDCGVAGLHRLLDHHHVLTEANVILAVAGMEGALPSVIGGLVDRPVIAVPTSVGYGASFQGLAALLAMLNSCASGVAVVNIDNGFGAAYLAGLVLRQRARGG
jgi:NCAIR mutase (PurE)-related protein